MSLQDGLAQTTKLSGYDLQPVRRVVTSHTEEGKAVFWKDEYVKPLPVTMTSGETAVFAHPWTTDSGKYDLNDSRDLSLLEDNSKLSNEDGTVVRVTDIPPNSISPLHRTVSLDYGIRMRRLLGGRQVAVTEPLTLLTVFKGSKIILHLEEGRKVEIGNGDIVVQRGTIHAWENPTDEYARMYFILQAAKPFLVDGKPLGDAGYEKAH